MISINDYIIPMPRKLLQRMDRYSSPAHVDKLRNAIDFVASMYTPVLAAADGVVTFVKDDSYIGGSDPSYWMYSNFITILHSNGEYSRYDHLDYKSSRVKVNQKVHVGKEIAKVGMGAVNLSV